MGEEKEVSSDVAHNMCHNPCTACNKEGHLDNEEICPACAGTGCIDKKYCKPAGGLGCDT